MQSHQWKRWFISKLVSVEKIEFYILQKYPYYKILLADRKQIDSLKHSKKRNTRVQSKIPKQKNN